MGAEFITLSLKGDLTEQKVREAFLNAQDEDRFENGHSYSGGFGMAAGLKFEDHALFASHMEASAWLGDHCEKWREAKAVRFKLGNEERWMIGAICAA